MCRAATRRQPFKNPFGYHCSALVPAKFLGLVCPSRLLTAKVGHTRHRLLCAAIHKKGPKNGYNSVYGCSGCRAGGKRHWPRRPQRPKAESLLPCEKSNIIWVIRMYLVKFDPITFKYDRNKSNCLPIKPQPSVGNCAQDLQFCLRIEPSAFRLGGLLFTYEHCYLINRVIWSLRSVSNESFNFIHPEIEWIEIISHQQNCNFQFILANPAKLLPLSVAKIEIYGYQLYPKSAISFVFKLLNFVSVFIILISFLILRWQRQRRSWARGAHRATDGPKVKNPPNIRFKKSWN